MEGWSCSRSLPQSREALETNSKKRDPTRHKAQGCDRCGRTNCSSAMVRLTEGGLQVGSLEPQRRDGGVSRRLCGEC